jgi:L-alanine-DL-glutamate epimerase-like enolase superfamily enzyme
MRRTMKVGRSLSIKPLPELVSHAERLAQEGYYGLTLKGSSDWRGDQARFIALRKALGPDFPLEIDPNQAYAVADAIRLVKALEPYDLANLEQPCPWWDLDGLQRIQQASSVPVTADESVMCPSDALQIIKRQAASQITLKLARLGGILAAKKVLTVADAGGLTCNMGSKHPFGIGTAALLHFCAAHAQVVEPLGYGSPLERFVDDILDTPIPFAQGVVTLPEGVGLGVSVDRHKLKLYAPEGPILIS